MKQQPKQPGAKPTHRVYVVTGEGKSATWTPIAAAWPHKDGKGFALSSDLIPVRIAMREITERADKGEQA